MGNHNVTRRRLLKETGGFVALGAAGSLLPWRRLHALNRPVGGAANWPHYGYDLQNTYFNS